jgi:hypothetical protein
MARRPDTFSQQDWWPYFQKAVKRETGVMPPVAEEDIRRKFLKRLVESMIDPFRLAVAIDTLGCRWNSFNDITYHERTLLLFSYSFVYDTTFRVKLDDRDYWRFAWMSRFVESDDEAAVYARLLDALKIALKQGVAEGATALIKSLKDRLAKLEAAMLDRVEPVPWRLNFPSAIVEDYGDD